ncbi:hypothetical protein OXX79_008088, partial [Metschnikowia pulcherrima]
LVTTKDIVERFRKFSFRSETYPILGNEDFVYQFDAAEIAPPQINEHFEFTENMPFRLERNALSLFPEFYFHFKRLFSIQSHVNEAYCRYDPEVFRSLFSGTEEDIAVSVNQVERSFATHFRNCLSPDVQEDYPMFYTRKNVETKFVDRIESDCDHRSVGARFSELVRVAQTGDVIPLIKHLMAFEFSEDQIWWAITTAYGGFAQTDSQIRTFNRKIKYWESCENSSLFSRVKGFVWDLQDAGIVDQDTDIGSDYSSSPSTEESG